MTRRCFSGFEKSAHFSGYNITAKRTSYGGVTFRSELEAYWAAFFDHVGMPWEYEPVSLGNWVPDFRLFGRFLCEVKPIEMTGFPVASTEYHWIKKTLGHGQVLIFGQKPTHCLACMVTADDLSISGRTVFFDPHAEFKMASVSDDGGNHPLRGNAEMPWREACAAFRRKAVRS